MKTIEINTTSLKYKVLIGDTIHHLRDYIKPQDEILIITDDLVNKLHMSTLLKHVGKKPYIFSLGDHAEHNKSLNVYETCVKFCLEHFLDRHLVVLGFGGGAVGDFAGFFASTYKRGVRFIQIPTTLLAHDSAVGGKTALNMGNVKNVIGSFYQPEVVVFHTNFLKTLSHKEILSGFGEVFKHDFLSDHYILDEVLSKDEDLDLVIQDDTKITDIIYRCILVKKLYIETDPYDTLGKRQYLNFGHTLAHAIEILYDMSHGEAVVFGICFDLFVSENDEYLNFYKRCVQMGYFRAPMDFNIEQLLQLIKNDKKNHQEKLRFIGLEDVGIPFEIELTNDSFTEYFTKFLHSIEVSS